MNERNQTAIEETPKARAARLAAKTALLSGLTKGVFFLLCLLSVLGFAFAVTYYDKEGGKTLAIVGLVCGIVLLLGAALSAALFSRAAAKAKKETEEALRALYEGEDGLSREFCLSIREEEAENLKTILEEQKDAYTPEEYAFIAKVYESKIK